MESKTCDCLRAANLATKQSICVSIMQPSPTPAAVALAMRYFSLSMLASATLCLTSAISCALSGATPYLIRPRISFTAAIMWHNRLA